MKKTGGLKRVERYLKRHIRALGPGSPLPSFRIIADDCRVSGSTVLNTVMGLEKMNLLVRRPQKGIFTAGLEDEKARQNKRLGSVDIVYDTMKAKPSEHMPFFQELHMCLSAAAALYSLRLRFHGISEADKGCKQFIEEIAMDDECDACMIINLTDREFLTPLEDENIPFVCLFPSSLAMPPNSVALDAEQIVSLQIMHLTTHGHRHISYLHNVLNHNISLTQYMRLHEFYRLALDMKLPIDSSYVRRAGYAKNQQLTAARELLSLPEPPSAIICADDHLAAVYQAIRESGKEPGREISVVGTNDDHTAVLATPPATSVRIPRQRAANAAFEMLEEAASTPGGIIPSQFIDCNLVIRQTTCQR